MLSTPNLLTLDNEEAKIVIGKNVPFVTGSFTNTGSSKAVNPFQTVERKDVGLTLRVKPADQRKRHGQDADLPGGLQRAGVTRQFAHRPHHQQALHRIQRAGGRRQIIVLGGLMQDELFRQTEDKVPVPGRHPGSGQPVQQRNPLAQEDQPDGVPAPRGGARCAQPATALCWTATTLSAALQQAAQPAPAQPCVTIYDAPVLPPLARPRTGPPDAAASCCPANRPPETPADAPPAALRLCPHRTSCCWRTMASELVLWHGPRA